MPSRTSISTSPSPWHNRRKIINQMTSSACGWSWSFSLPAHRRQFHFNNSRSRFAPWGNPGAPASRRQVSRFNPNPEAGVASGILPDVEDGILPPGKGGRNTKGRQHDQPPDWTSMVLSAALETRLYGRQGCPPLHQAMLPRPIRLRVSASKQHNTPARRRRSQVHCTPTR